MAGHEPTTCTLLVDRYECCDTTSYELVRGYCWSGVRGLLLDRVAESARLDELLDAARSGFGGSLVVVGDAGVGKTSLLEHAAGSADGMTVLRARGMRDELDLAFSTLADLVGRLSDQFGRLPPDQAAVLAGALAIGPPREASLFAVLVAAQALVVATARERPLLLVIDDGQWLDTPSRRAVLYLARRAHLEPVAMLIAVRDDQAEVIRSTGLRELASAGSAERMPTSCSTALLLS